MNTDNKLLQLLNSGDEKAIKFIFDKYYENLCLYAESLVKDHGISEEIVEDIFIYLWMNIKTTHVQVSVKNYLYKSTYNNCLKYLNKLKSEKRTFEQLHYTLEDDEIIHSLTPNYPLSNLIVNEIEEKAEKAIELLPKHCKEIYLLSRFENLSYSEIAVKLNITIGTVKTQMSRAFQKLREELKDFLPILFLLF